MSIPPPEYSSAIYYDWTYYEPVYGRKAEARAKGGHAVVGTGGFGGDTEIGPGGGADGGGGQQTYRKETTTEN